MNKFTILEKSFGYEMNLVIDKTQIVQKPSLIKVKQKLVIYSRVTTKIHSKIKKLYLNTNISYRYLVHNSYWLAYV